MLEHAALWLSTPMAVCPPGITRAGSGVRWIQSADDQSIIGYCTRIPARYLPWPKRARMAVYETPDESLLLQVRSEGWFSETYHIADADGKQVATVTEQLVRVAMRSFRMRSNGRSGSFSEIGGEDVANWRPERSGVRLAFGDLVRHEPFIKMAFLGAVLATH